MKVFPYIILLLCMTMSAACHRKPAPIVIIPDIEKNHLQHNHIFGTVKNMETRTFYLQPDSLTLQDSARARTLTEKRDSDRMFSNHYSYDGCLLRFFKINADGDTLLQRLYQYNDRAQIAQWTEFSGPSPTTHGVFSYDRNHFVESEKIYYQDSLVMSFSHKTDGIGNIIATTQDNQDFVINTRYHYNDNGLVDKIEELEPDGTVFKTVNIEYDNYGDEVNRCVYKAGHQLVEYTYTQYDQDGRILKTIYEDKLHNQKEINYYTDFDSARNWRIEYTILNNQLVSIRKRNINYYQQHGFK